MRWGGGGVRNYFLMRSETPASVERSCSSAADPPEMQVPVWRSGLWDLLPLRMHARMHAPDWTIQPTLLPPGGGCGGVGVGGVDGKVRSRGFVSWDDPRSCQIIHLSSCICCASEVGQVGRDSQNSRPPTPPTPPTPPLPNELPDWFGPAALANSSPGCSSWLTSAVQLTLFLHPASPLLVTPALSQ